jgi:hypothetical protein
MFARSDGHNIITFKLNELIHWYFARFNTQFMRLFIDILLVWASKHPNEWITSVIKYQNTILGNFLGTQGGREELEIISRFGGGR